MQKIVDIRKLRSIVGKAACGFQDGSGETQQGLTIEQTLSHIVDCLVENNSFSRDYDELTEVLYKLDIEGSRS